MAASKTKSLVSLLFVGPAVAAIALLAAAPAAFAQAARTPVVFENVMIFDGQSDALSGPSNVLVKDGKIAGISTTDISEDGATVIDGEGKVLMPGLIDAHWHTMLIGVTPDTGLADMGYTHLIAGVEATATLMRGFTTVRDLGGPAFGLKKIIDQGLIPGPRIYPSGAILTVTSGHGDFRTFADLPRRPGVLTPMEEAGMSMVTDTPDEVRIRAREQLMQGASQIKLTAGGGVASPFSPLDVSTFTSAEIVAAVEAAANWGTYVGVHAYTPQAVQTAINSGVKVIEHAHLIDDETAQMMADKGIWLSTQPFTEQMGAGLPPSSLDKFHEVLHGTTNIYGFAKKYNIKTAWGTDILFSPILARGQNAMLVNMLEWYTAAEALKMATGTNGELLLLSGERNPYPGRIGLIEEGAYADLLLVDGNPLEDLSLVGNPEKNFLIIMKDGVIYKDITGEAE
ncbi:MAG: amidohydrolase family protein [Devosia sp.]|uniref:metal-dependent hydrolase family protein n=1 Tax=Devosia sp. TaxID=1871048 RepID=UPI0033941D97